MKQTINVEQVGPVKHVGVRGCPGFLRFGEYLNATDDYLDFRLEVLRRHLAKDSYIVLMKQLGDIPGFDWVRGEENFTKTNSYKRLGDLALEESDYHLMSEGLRNWIQRLTARVEASGLGAT